MRWQKINEGKYIYIWTHGRRISVRKNAFLHGREFTLVKSGQSNTKWGYPYITIGKTAVNVPKELLGKRIRIYMEVQEK